MVSNHPAKFGAHMYCDSGDMFLVVDGQDSTCRRLGPPLLFISIKHTTIIRRCLQ